MQSGGTQVAVCNPRKISRDGVKALDEEADWLIRSMSNQNENGNENTRKEKAPSWTPRRVYRTSGLRVVISFRFPRTDAAAVLY